MHHHARIVTLCLAVLAACTGQAPQHSGGTAAMPDASTATAAAACEAVGTSLCQKFYTCLSATEISSLGLPATQDECVTQENSGCNAAAPAPGYCKGSPQTSASAATACASELSALTCTEFNQPTASGACKTELCAN